MKVAVIVIAPLILLPSLLLLGGGSHTSLPGTHAIPPVALPSQSSDSTSSPTFSQVLIEPGASVGPLKLGDSPDRALELFPKKYEDQQWDDSCGTTFVWADTENSIRGGTLLIRVKKGKVFQIESATTRFHTAEGIAALDSPDKVAHDYKDLRAYTLLTAPVAALGSRPLVFWIDKKKGIAFAFAYYPSQHKRYLYKIIVFAPNKNFCPEQETTGSPKWQPIPAYAVEPPPELAPNHE
jgi:hypothetical protein